ncbi:TPA: helix-turn-helix domain-containing protein [Enterococcus faecalis]
MEKIFSNDDYSKLQVFSYIENSNQERISIKEIQEQFDMTYFKATKIMNSLILDFNDINFGSYFKLEKKSNKYMFKKNGLDSINRLLWKYGRESQIFRVLDYSIKYPSKTMDDYSFDYFISLSTAYKARKRLIVYLEERHANIFSDNYNEENFRYLVTQLYTSIFKFYEYPFSKKLFSSVNEVISQLENEKITIHTEGFERLQLVFYLSISMLRIMNSSKHKQLSHVESILADSGKIEQVVSKLFSKLTYNLDITLNDIRMIINYFKVSNILNDELMEGLNNKYSLLIELGIHRFFLNSIFKEYKNTLEIPIKKLFLKSIFFKDVFFDKQFYTQLRILKESYRDIYESIIKNLEKKELVDILGDQSKNKSFILEFIFCIINNIDLKKVTVTVTVTVNFSVGSEYNRYIMTIIENLPFANLQVNDKYTEETDIYLSDIIIDNVTSAFVIWNNPPTANDWKLFGNLISKIKDDKLCKKVL